MKRRVFFLFFMTLAVMALSAAETPWEWNAEKADSFFYSQEYDAAWLFYQRAMIDGVDDAKILFRAAESFSRQEMVDNPDFGAALYAISHSLMQEQYPEDPVLVMAADKADPDIVVNRRFIRKTYSMVGAKAPPARRSLGANLSGRALDFFSSRMEELGTFWSVLRTDGFRDGFGYARSRLWNLLVAYLMISLIPGIVLPVVMAVTVAREGRKSYVTAYGFLLFWGPLGIHRFYLGRPFSGVLWLLTGGLAGIGLFFDLFLTGAYIRFWNEDHRTGRPVSGISTGSGQLPGIRKARKATPPRSTKTTKTKKVKSPKPPKAVKPPGKKKSRSGNKGGSVSSTVGAAAVGAAAGIAEDEGFSFAGGSDETNLDFDTAAGGDDDFGNLPDLDLGGDDFDIPTAESGDDGLGDLNGDADEFDLGSLE